MADQHETITTIRRAADWIREQSETAELDEAQRDLDTARELGADPAECDATQTAITAERTRIATSAREACGLAGDQTNG